MNFERPILKLKPSKLDITLDWGSFAILILTWIYTIVYYTRLPQIIPAHFDLNGKVDDHGSKELIFILPAIITIVFAGMTIVNKYPHVFNYLQKITTKNAEQQYTGATRLMRIIKFIITLFSLIFMIDIINSAIEGHSKLSWWVIPIFMLSMLVPVVISLITLGKKKHNS